jgi:hypothetical protein
MAQKHNANRRRHIPKTKFTAENWPEHDAGSRRRGSRTLSIEALDHWQTRGPGGQARDSDAAIQTSLMLGAPFRCGCVRPKA